MELQRGGEGLSHSQRQSQFGHPHHAPFNVGLFRQGLKTTPKFAAVVRSPLPPLKLVPVGRDGGEGREAGVGVGRVGGVQVSFARTLSEAYAYAF